MMALTTKLLEKLRVPQKTMDRLMKNIEYKTARQTKKNYRFGKK